MENKDYVTCAQARKLKELGFDYPCYFYYTKEDAPDDCVWHTTSEAAPIDYNRSIYAGCSMPSLWEAQKWLREVHKIHIAVIGNYDCGGNLYAFEVWLQRVTGGRRVLLYETKKLSDLESALSSGISAALEILGKEGKK